MANYVGLNVGGTIYRTSRTTLGSAPGSFFSTLISGEIPSERDEQGNYLIDRDGEVFRHILNFLRNGTLLLPHGFKDFSLLEREADFFMLESLKKEIPVGINCSGAIFQIPRSDFDREPTSCLRDILSGEKVTPLDADGNVLLDIPQDHFRYLREYLKPGNNVFSTTRFMLGNSDICPSLSKAADIFGLNILQAHVNSVQRMEGKIDSDSDPPTRVLLDLYYDSSDGVYTMYCTGFLGIFKNVSSALSRLTLRDLGGVHGATFSLNKDRAGTDVQHLIENDDGHHIPSNWEEMIALMSKITRSLHSHTTDVCAGCKKAEFEADFEAEFDDYQMYSQY